MVVEVLAVFRFLNLLYNGRASSHELFGLYNFEQVLTPFLVQQSKFVIWRGVNHYGSDIIVF